MRISPLERRRVESVVVGPLLIGVSGRAGRLSRGTFVYRARHVRVAVRATEHAAVNRLLERFLVDVETDLLPIDLFGETRVAVARQAIGVARFRPDRVLSGDPTLAGNRNEYE